MTNVPDKPINRIKTTTSTQQREKLLYECAVAVEKDSALNQEMEDWHVTIQDGLDGDPYL